MVNIKIQKDFDLKEESNDLVILFNTKSIVKELDGIFDGFLVKTIKKPFTTIPTFGKIKAKNIHIINHKDFLNIEKRTQIYKNLSDIKEDICILIDTFPDDMISELVEQLITNHYEFNFYKSHFENNKKTNKNIYLYGETKHSKRIEKGIIYGESINNCRTLVNKPLNKLNALDLANYAKQLERINGIKVQIFSKNQIEKMNMGAFLGVNKGSKDDPQLILVKYENSQDETTALVGKGVMYDTGGYSIKTSSGMPGMKSDMAGAAAVLSAIEGIARLQLKANVIAVVAATDNKIGDDAIVPDDILTAANGKTIEIVSTDAEGRLTLADAVWFAQQQGATKIIDVATLTGAMVRALGKEYTGAFTNDTEFLKELTEASKRVNENIWHMPISKGYHKLIESKVADIKNTGGPLAGSSTAAAFIENFIENNSKWIHLDIAGTATDNNSLSTGVMVKTFCELFYK
jgi:leucyl aminopeptidase